MKVLIIEDEHAAARRLEKMLLDIQPDADIIATLDSIDSAVSYLQENKNLDLILLDIHLADGPCFEIFERVDVLIPIIFTTAYDQYAIQAFKSHAIDYLLKPVKKEALSNALTKLQSLQSWAADFQSIGAGFDKPGQSHWQKRFLIRIGQSIKLVSTEEIAYFYTEDKITLLVTNAGKRYPLDFTLEQVERMVDPKLFFRINRQFVLGIQSIKEMFTYSKSRIRVHLTPSIDQEIIVPFERASGFKTWLLGKEKTE